MRTLVVWLFLTSLAWAQDLIVCDPTHPLVPNAVTRSERTGDFNAFLGRSGFLVWDAPHTLHTPEQVAAFNQLRSQLDSLQSVPTHYWKCLDTDADGLLDAVTEMTQAEQDAVDAPPPLTPDDAALATLDATLADDAAWTPMGVPQQLDLLRRREVLQRRLGR